MFWTISSSLLPFSRGAKRNERVSSLKDTITKRDRRLTAVHLLPVVEHRLRERLSRRRSPQLAVEAERLHDGQVGLDGEHGGSGTLLFTEDLSTALVKNGVDTTDGVLRALDLDKIDGLLKTGGSKQASGVADTTAGGDDLSSTTVDGISVELEKVPSVSK